MVKVFFWMASRSSENLKRVFHMIIKDLMKTSYQHYVRSKSNSFHNKSTLHTEESVGELVIPVLPLEGALQQTLPNSLVRINRVAQFDKMSLPFFFFFLSFIASYVGSFRLWPSENKTGYLSNRADTIVLFNGIQHRTIAVWDIA